MGKWEMVMALQAMAESQAVSVEWQVDDKILTFRDGSRLGLVSLGANTMAGASRVMEAGDASIRAKVRGGKPYDHGKTKTAWHWTKNGKTYGKPPRLVATTGQPCPKSGFWVRTICRRGCADSSEVVKSVWIGEGDEVGKCTTCHTDAMWEWITP